MLGFGVLMGGVFVGVTQHQTHTHTHTHIHTPHIHTDTHTHTQNFISRYFIINPELQRMQENALLSSFFL